MRFDRENNEFMVKKHNFICIAKEFIVRTNPLLLLGKLGSRQSVFFLTLDVDLILFNSNKLLGQ